MTPKDKAEELCFKFQGEFNMNWTMSKRCALIAVDETQDFITKYDNHFQDFKYWDEVTQEIQNL